MLGNGRPNNLEWDNEMPLSTPSKFHRHRALKQGGVKILFVSLLLAGTSAYGADTAYPNAGYDDKYNYTNAPPASPQAAPEPAAPGTVATPPYNSLAAPGPVVTPTPPEAGNSPPKPDDYGRFSIMDENDYFASHDDRHYTQGARVSYLTPSITGNDMWDAPFNFLSDTLPIMETGPERKRKYEITGGQSIFTPTNVITSTPSPKDRPYAAWLYGGASLLQETHHQTHTTLENFEIDAGIVGPAALGGVTQNDFHQFIGDTASLGWQNQLHNEPGGMVTYERKWRFEAPLISNFGFDAIPELGVTGGNIMTYGEAGGMVRMGQNLRADYGPERIRPSLSGTAWFDPDQLTGPLGWYVFLGTQGRAVAHNIFLDGNMYAPSPSVEKKPLVEDFMGGASLFWSEAVRLDFTVTQRSKEFYGQRGTPDRFGGVNFAFSF